MEISKLSIRALYEALHAARKQASGIRISNDHLRLGMRQGKRLSKSQIDKLAATFEPIFPRHEIEKDQYGRMSLVLHLNEKDDPVRTRRIVPASIPDQATVKKALGID